MGPEVAFLDRYTFVHKHTRGVSCTNDVTLCVLTATGIPVEPCSQSCMRGGGRPDTLALRVRMALKTLYRAQQRPGSPSTHLLAFFDGQSCANRSGGGSKRHNTAATGGAVHAERDSACAVRRRGHNNDAHESKVRTRDMCVPDF